MFIVYAMLASEAVRAACASSGMYAWRRDLDYPLGRSRPQWIALWFYFLGLCCICPDTGGTDTDSRFLSAGRLGNSSDPVYAAVSVCDLASACKHHTERLHDLLLLPPQR